MKTIVKLGIGIMAGSMIITALVVFSIDATKPAPLPEWGHRLELVSAKQPDPRGWSEYYRIRVRDLDDPAHPEFEWRGVCPDEPPPTTARLGVTVSVDGKQARNFWTNKEHTRWCSGELHQHDPMPRLRGKDAYFGRTQFTLIAFSLALAAVVVPLLWLVPIYLARRFHHPQFVPITIITLLLGWTFVAWVLCLAWSMTHLKRKVLAHPAEASSSTPCGHSGESIVAEAPTYAGSKSEATSESAGS